MSNIKIKVAQNTDLRLDKYIVQNTNLSRNKVKFLFDNGFIFLNNKKVNKLCQSLKINDEINITIQDNDKQSEIHPISLVKPINLPLEIVFEDEDILIINKPSGLLVYPTKHNENDTLAHRLANYFIDKNIFLDAVNYRFGIVHRLDKDTSGLLIIAKNPDIFNILKEMMKNNLIKRKYIAIVNNCFNPKDFLFKINVPIGRVYDNELRMRANSTKDPKEAITIVNVIKNINNKFAIVECELITGRTHQIRVHMQYINHPVYNDPIYGIDKKTTKYNQYLYCANISFYHPISNDLINVSLDYPKEFEDFIKNQGE